MGQVSDWWLNRTVDADWQLPISSFQGFRPIGGYLLGTTTSIEFVPNRFEARAGGLSWLVALDDVEKATLGLRRLQIVARTGTHTLCTARPRAVRHHLAALLARPPVASAAGPR